VTTIATAATGGGSPIGNPITNISNAILGLFEGLLNLVEKSPFTYILIAAWALPFIGRGCSALYKAYSDKQQDKTREEMRKEVGVNKEGIEDTYNKIKEQNPDAKPSEIEQATKNTISKQTQDLAKRDIQNRINNNKMTLEEGQAELTTSTEDYTKNNEKTGLEGEEYPDANAADSLTPAAEG
jgi:hypothetical protein